ncbi:MAG: DNA repair protein RecO [Clostridia bacterium]|nr:DNA repair protein RecO [Clostridia bacterium]
MRNYFKTKGIVIKEVSTGEADKILSILSRTQGKISCFARYARRPKSRLVAGSQLFSYGEFVLFKSHDMFSVNSCDVIESFYEIRNDIIKLSHAAHIMDIINDVIQEGQSSPKSLQLLLNTLHMLSKSQKSPELITRIFEFRLLSILGYAPYVKGCIICEAYEDNMMFSFKKCAFLCKACKTNDINAIPIHPGTAKAISHIVCSPMKELFSFDVSPQVLSELGIISKRYLKDRLEKEYNKLDFLKMI